jgi:hypothetical protein
MLHAPTGQSTRGFSWRLAILWAACLAAVLTGGRPSFAADDAKAAKALPADLALVPPDAAAFLCLEVGKHWNGPEAESLKKITQAHPLVLTWETKDFEKEIGLRMADIERILLVFPDFEAGGFVYIFTTGKPFDRDKVLGALVPGSKETKVGAKTYFVSDKSKFGVRLLNDRTILFGSDKDMRAFLSRPAADKGGALRSAVAAAADKHLLVAGVNPSAFLAAVKNSGEKGKNFVPLFEAKSWRITADAAKE